MRRDDDLGFMESLFARRDTIDSIVCAEVTVPERKVRSDNEPQWKLEAPAERHGGRKLQLEREGVRKTTIVTSIGATRRKIRSCVVVIRRPVVYRISHRHLQHIMLHHWMPRLPTLPKVHEGPQNLVR